MNRIVSTLFVLAVAALLVLSGCGSGKIALQHGNYYEAVITSVNHLRRDPGHKKSIETLQSAYPMGVTYYEGLATTTLAANGQFKWTETVNIYTTLNSMGDEIRRCPGALKVIPNPTNYAAKLNEAKQKAAEEQYQAGIMALGTGDREKAKLAYIYFKRSIEFVAGYRDAAQKMQDALWAATVKVLVEPIPTQTKLLASSTDAFNARVSEYLHQNQVNEYVKFYSPGETQQLKLYPDQIVRLEFEDFNVGNVYMSEKQIPLKRDSVLVAATVNNQTITINNIVNNTNVTNNNIVNNTVNNNTTNNNTVNNNTVNNNTTNNNTVNNNTTNNNTTSNTVNNNTTNSNTVNNNTTNNTVNNTTNNTSNTNTVNNNAANTSSTNNNSVNNTTNNNPADKGNEEKKEEVKEIKKEEVKEEKKEEVKETPKEEVKEEKKDEPKEEKNDEVKEEKKEEVKETPKEETKTEVKEEKKEEPSTKATVDFAVETSGSVAVKENACANIKCLGEAVVYNNTQDAFVKVMFSIDNGVKWFDFNNANFVKGGEQSTVQVPNGSQVIFKVVAQTQNGSWSNTLTTNTSSEWVYVLRNGDKAPNIAPAQNQASVETFLKGVITDGKITIGPNDVIYLFELRHVGNVGVDYQDAVMLLTFGANSGCQLPQNPIVETIPETEQVTICHVPPGNAASRHTLTISRSALKAHLEHGDFEGSCEDPKNANKLKEVEKKAAEQKKNDKSNDNKGEKKSSGGGFGLANYQPMLIASSSNDIAWMSLLSEELDTTKIYASVKGTLNYFSKTVSSKGVVRMTITDAKTKAVLSSTQIPGEYVWTSEWATFNGDERVLSSQHVALTRNREQMPPTQQELFQAFAEPIYQQVIQKLKDFYKGY